MNIKLNPSWLNILKEEFEKPYFSEIKNFLKSEIEAGKTIYPHPKNIFHAFDMVDFQDVKVVILGQDPYHGEGQAHGMSFSVQQGVKIPPSLRNIFKEIKSEGLLCHPERSEGSSEPTLNNTQGIDSSVVPPSEGQQSGDLTPWAKQGILLLNSILTVEAEKPASHSKIGWENFTDAVIQTISQEREGVIFLLWGNFAKTKKTLIDISKHLILEAPHPSPFSAHSGFFGCDHFKKVNTYLKKNGEEINWSI